MIALTELVCASHRVQDKLEFHNRPRKAERLGRAADAVVETVGVSCVLNERSNERSTHSRCAGPYRGLGRRVLPAVTGSMVG